MAKPFIKWVGGKGKLSPLLESKMPKDYKRYIEPFVGGGAMFFHINPKEAVISDKNPSLINTYIQIRDNRLLLEEELDLLQTEFNGLETKEEKAEYYYERREEYNSFLPNHAALNYRHASLFIFLNKAGFNGIYRENRNGNFNVPFGKKDNIKLYDKTNFSEIQHILHNTEILCGDFEGIIKQKSLRPKDFVFFDSPYAETYDGYQKDGFQEEEHERLNNLFVDLTKKGVYCMLTNSSCKYIKTLYKDFVIEEINSIHSVNRNGYERNAKEVIIRNY